MTPDEIANIFLEYRRTEHVFGLFLTSGVTGMPHVHLASNSEILVLTPTEETHILYSCIELNNQTP